MSPIVNSFHKKKKAKSLRESAFFFFLAFWMKWICFHNFIMKVCLMQKQMHQIQKVINTACVAAYGKSEVKKNKFFHRQDVGTYQMDHQLRLLGLAGTAPPHPQPRSPVVGFFNGKYGFQMSAGFLRREAKHQWGSRGMSTQGHQLHNRQLLQHTFFMLCWSTSARGETWAKSCFQGRLCRPPQHFKLLSSRSFIVHLNDKVPFLNHPHVLLYQLLMLGMFTLVWF